MISTPNGLNHFYTYWTLAQLKDIPKEELPPGMKWNGYIPLHVTWKQVPGRDEEWLENTMQQLNFDQLKFQQEYECEFQGSSGTLISGDTLRRLKAEVPMKRDKELWLYRPPQPKHMYVVTADVAEGKGMDYSTFHVTDVSAMPFDQCAVYRSNETTPADFAEVVYRMAKAYNNAQILIEYESLGPEVAMTIFDIFDYENVLCSEFAGRLGKRLTMRAGKGVDRGIKMSIAVKSTGCSLLKLLVEQDQYLIHDQRTIEEAIHLFSGW